MIERIEAIRKQEVFDFREFAYAKDELSYLFPEWVEYYRTKHAICKAIGPKSILEIGVRYGYSAIAFLDAAGDASYLGIDSDSASFGGSVGAIEWAKHITEGYNATFLVGDPQSMTELPGDFYDLIHVDAQQDGDGTYHDLEMALEKARYILVDGYFRSSENMLSATYFLKKYQKFIEFSLVISGYAGELLIKTAPNARHIFHTDRKCEALRQHYDASYYLQDCGGFDTFKRSGGRELEDDRLLALHYLADPRKGQTILDVGCGRGELSLALSRAGANVVGIDYSEASIGIARQLLKAPKGDVGGELEFVREDILGWNPDRQFDRIVAGDFVEHIEENLFEKMLEKLAGLLKSDGVFILHTAPNKLNYTYSYNKKRALVRQAGAYLPRNPRTFYEDLMHINEQTPAGLRRLLAKHFDCVRLWAATLPDMLGTLDNVLTKTELAQATSIFAVASQRRIEREEIVALLTQDRLALNGLDAEIYFEGSGLHLRKSERRKLPITVHNRSNERFVSLRPYPVNLAYHWMDSKGGMVVFDGMRTPIKMPLLPGQKRNFDMDIMAPGMEGEYVLQVSLVQEGNFWFEQIIKTMPLNVAVDVR